MSSGPEESRKLTYREAVREAIREAMRKDDRVFLMGEDVGKALSEAGDPKSQVEVFQNAEHLMLTSKTGCPEKLQKKVIRAFLWFAIRHGATSPEQINAEIAKDPYKPGLLASFPFAPGFLDLMENWLKGLYADEQ